MSTGTRKPDETIAVLTIMAGLAERGRGYEVHGVRGWARSAEVNQLLDVFYPSSRYAGASEELRLGLARRYYEREDVRVSGAVSPVWVYRVTQEGARLAADWDERELSTLQPPRKAAQDRVWMPETAPVALSMLRWAARHPGRREWIPGEAEWRTCLELTNALKSHNDAVYRARAASGEPDRPGDRDPSFQPPDLQWLVRAGYAEQRRSAERVVLYRITPAGEAAQPLEWQGPAPAFTRPQD